MQEFARAMSDAELLAVVKAMDSASVRLDRRFEGDDDALVQLMDRLALPQDIASKALITGEVLRECVHRGLSMPRGN
ncbi:hypothetical protein GOB57_24805 [Sinorhizobium meliloti]|nr:hypothetical protein [Sinorhizobium meliloti]